MKDISIERQLDSIMALMNIDDKIGQMSQLSGHGEVTGPIDTTHSYLDDVKNGRVGSMLNIIGSEYTRRLQKIAVEETRLGIPLIFAYDVIHGYRTIFPVPLGEAASWDLEAIEKSARIAAIEASSAGQHWTFAPMVDISRDPRWGRIMEGAGEDTYLGSEIAKARVRGFQGNDLNDLNTIAACAKHYAAYGAAEGGRDYNTTDMSERTLRQIYLPPFQACVDENVATFMTAFNDLNGIPASANGTLKEILRTEWQYDGLVVSDWNSIGELIPHGIAEDKYAASKLGMIAGIDMDMEGYSYEQELKSLIEAGEISEEEIDQAVRRILRLKMMLGLFDDPYRYSDTVNESKKLLAADHLEAARDVARKSIVLLKNKNDVLPLKKSLNKIALIGPLADNQSDLIGNWSAQGKADDVITLRKALEDRLKGKTNVLYAKGCEYEGTDKSGFSEAVKIATVADLIIVAVGEGASMSGEAHSRSSIDLPGVQLDLLKALKNTGKPMVIILMNGRPLAIPWENENADAIIEAWLPGTQGGNAVTDVLTGEFNPSGKLPVTFPYATGQIPVYYNHKNTGRPPNQGHFNSKYDDIPWEPLFPFGFGLSYTTFEYTDLKIDKSELHPGESLMASVTVSNTGDFDGSEVVQLYIRDLVGSVTRPVKELKAFRKVYIPKGESVDLTFEIKSDDLKFININMEFKVEAGEFELMIGPNSRDYKKTNFTLTKD